MTQPDFIQIPTQLLSDNTLKQGDRILFGYIYWMTKLALMKCVASNAILHELTGLTQRSIQAGLERLERSGYIERTYSDTISHHRTEILCLVSFGKTPRSNTRTPRTTERSPHALQNVALRSNVHEKTQNNRGKLAPNKSIKEEHNKKKVETGVSTGAEAPVTYGKPELNELFNYWNERTGLSIHSRPKPNRNACSNLYRKFGVDGVRRLIDGVAESQTDQYAPRISDFESLQAKLNDLLSWGKRRVQAKSGKVVVIS